MKFTVERGPLLAALSPLVRIVARKPNVPVLGNVLIEAVDGGLTLVGTDQDREVCTAVQAEIATPGSLTLPCHTLSDFLRKTDSKTVTIEAEDGGARARIAAGKARVTLHALPASDFPNIGESPATSTFTLPARDLRRPFERVAYAQSQEETRYYLCGVYVHVVDGDLAFVATDGHRLGRSTIPVPAGAEGLTPVILPAPTVAELLKLLDIDENATVEVNGRMVRVMAGPVTIVSKLIDGTYPDYRRVIPTSHDRTLRICAKALLAAVERVATITSERGSRVTLKIGEDGVGLTMRSPEAGDSSDQIDGSLEGEPISIAFNSKYVTGVLSAIAGDEIEVWINEPGAPVVLHDPSEAQTLRLMMPMSVQ